jgi:hypothetical protein
VALAVKYDERFHKIDVEPYAEAFERLTPDPDDFHTHDPDTRPTVRKPRDAEKAVLGLDPDSCYPRSCDYCGDEDRGPIQETPVVHGRWWMHPSCIDLAFTLMSIERPACDWDWPEGVEAPSCGLRRRPAALTNEKISEIATLRTGWKLTQQELAARAGVDQATVSRALEKAERMGIRPKRIKGEQLSLIDWFGDEGRRHEEAVI